MMAPLLHVLSMALYGCAATVGAVAQQPVPLPKDATGPLQSDVVSLMHDVQQRALLEDYRQRSGDK